MIKRRKFISKILFSYIITPRVSDGCNSFDIVCVCVSVTVVETRSLVSLFSSFISINIYLSLRNTNLLCRDTLLRRK